MTMYAPSDMTEITVGEAHGGCGAAHRREAGPDGLPVQPWGVTCPGKCETFLEADGRWSKTVEEIVPTFDETKARERFELQGSKDKDALMMVAMARMAGIDQSQIPATVQHMIRGLAPHIPGQTVCPKNHANTPGSRYCSQCGAAMSAPAAAAALPSGQLA